MSDVPWLGRELATAALGALNGREAQVLAVVEGERAKNELVEAIAFDLMQRCPMVLTKEAWVNIAKNYVVQACMACVPEKR